MMREWIRLIEVKPAKHGLDGMVPDELYHGTSLQNYQEIRATNTFVQNSEGTESVGFSTTEDETVAIKFARMKSYGQRWGVVLTLNGPALAKSYHVEPYNDDDEYSNLGQYEYEWIVTSKTGNISPANRYITEVRVIDMQGDSNWLQPWDDTAHGVTAPPDEADEDSGVTKLRQAYTRQQAQTMLLGLAQQVHPDQSIQNLRDLIAKLKGDKLYQMLWRYQRRVKEH